MCTGQIKDESKCCQVRKRLCDEFKCRNFVMNHEDPALFVTFQCFSPVWYLPWTIFWFLFFASMVVIEIVHNHDSGADYFVFLTNVTFIVQSIAVSLDMIITIYVNCARKDLVEGLVDETPWYIQITWVFYNVVNTASLLVTIGYYSLVEPILWTHGSINLHILNSVYTVLLLIFSAKPIRILHFYQPMIYALLYTLVSLFYDIGGHDPIYGLEGPLDWENKTVRTVVLSVIVIFVVTPAMHLATFVAYKLRVALSTSCGCSNKVDDYA